MTNLTGVVNTPLKFYFKAPSGQSTFADKMLIKDGATLSLTTLTITEVATSGIYTVAYTPSVTGSYCFYVNAEIVAQFEVITRSPISFLQNLEDEALGSWTWNKQTGKLDMIRQNGTSLASFDVVENLTTASREKI